MIKMSLNSSMFESEQAQALQVEARLGDFTWLHLEDAIGQVQAGSSPSLRVGDLIFLTSSVTYFPEKTESREFQSLKVKAEKAQGSEVAAASTTTLVLTAEGIADTFLYVLSLPTGHSNDQIHKCLFEVQKCLTQPSSDSLYSKEALKDFANRTVGETINYGDQIQLRHVNSDKYLTFSTEPGYVGFRITLDERNNKATWIKVLSSTKETVTGRSVLYDEKIALSAKCEGVDLFLSLHGLLHDSNPSFEVCSYSHRSFFQFRLFRPRSDVPDVVDICEPVQFQHKDLTYFLSRSSQGSRILLSKSQESSRSFWRLEPIDGKRGAVMSETQYFLKNVVAGEYLCNNLKLSKTVASAGKFRLVTGKIVPETVADGMDCALENEARGRILIETDEIEGEDVFKMVPVRQTKEKQKVINLSLGINSSEDTLFLFEIRKVQKKMKEFVRKVSEVLPFFQSFSQFLVEIDEKSAISGESWDWENGLKAKTRNVVRALRYLDVQVMTSPSKEEMAQYQDFLVDCDAHMLLLQISKNLSNRLTAELQSAGQVAKIPSIKSLKLSRGSNFMQKSLADTASELIPAILALLNSISYQNLRTSTEFSKLDKEICELFPYSKKLTAMLLSEVYRLVDPPILDYGFYYSQWFDRLSTVSKENIHEQTAFVRLLRHVSEQAETVNAMAQAQLTKLVTAGERQFQLVRLRVEDGEPVIWFARKEKEMKDEEFLELNPDLKSIAVQGKEGIVLPLLAMNTSKSLITYQNYIGEALLLINILCKENNKAAIVIVEGEMGLTPELTLSLSTDDRLSISIRRSFMFLCTTLILSNQLTDARGKVPTLQLMTEIKEEQKEIIETQDENSHRLTSWCLGFWVQDHQMRYSAKETLEFLRAVLLLTSTIIEKQHVNSLFVKAINPAVENLLIGIVDPESTYLSSDHWIKALMGKVATESKVFSLGLNQSVKNVTEIAIGLIKKNYEVLRRHKVQKLLQHFSTIRGDMKAGDMVTTGIREIVTMKNETVAEVHDRVSVFLALRQHFSSAVSKEPLNSQLRKSVAEPNIREFLGSMAFSNLKIDSDLRNDLMDLLVTLINTHITLALSVKNTQLVEDPALVHIRDQFHEIMNLFAVTKSPSKLSLSLSNPYSPMIPTLTDGLKRLLKILCFRTAKPDVFRSAQDLARHFTLHLTLVRLWTEVEKRVPTQEDFRRNQAFAQMLVLTVNCLYYFVLDNDQNRLEMLKLVQTSFFTLYAGNAAYMISELTDFEHVPQRSAHMCYSAILRKCTFQPFPTLLTGLKWIQASIRHRDSKECKKDLQVLAAMAILDHLSSTDTSLLSPTDEDSMTELISLLSETAENNELVERQIKTLITFPALKECIKTVKNPTLFAVWMQFLVEAYGRHSGFLSEFDSLEIMEIVRKWLDRVISEGGNALVELGLAGLYEHLVPLENPEMVDLRNERKSGNVPLQLWRMVSAGDPWKREYGLCHSLPMFLLAAPQSGQAFQSIAREVGKRLFHLSQIVYNLDNTHHGLFETFYLKRATAACCNAFDLHFKGEINQAKINAAFHIEKGDLKSLQSLHRHSAENAGSDVAESSPIMEREQSRIEILGTQFSSFTTSVSQVCSEHSLSPAAAIKSLLIQIPTFAELMRVNVPFRHRSAGIKMIKVIIKKLDNEHKASIFDTLAILLDECKDKLMAKDLFTESGATTAAISAILARADLSQMKSAMKFLNKLLISLLAKFQVWLLGYLVSSEAYMGIFQLLSEELTCSIDRISYRRMHSGSSNSLVPSERLLLPKFFTTGMSVSTLLELNAELCHELVKFIKYCCEGCNLDFQHFMREQRPEGTGSINVVGLIANYLVNITENGEELLMDDEARGMIDICLETLVELVTGPCRENQLKLGADIQLLFALVKLMTICNANRHNRDWVDIYQDILSFLHTLLEGAPPQDELETMGKYLDIPLLTKAMESIYQDFVQRHEQEVLLELLDERAHEQVELGFSIAMLVMKLRGVLPSHADLADYSSWSTGLRYGYFGLEVMRHIPRNFFGFYASLIGYVEISRNGVIESNYFKIPYKCKFLTNVTKKKIIDKSMSVSQLKKLQNFRQVVQLAVMEMAHQQKLYCRPWIKFLSQSWQTCGYSSFILIFTINILLLASANYDTLIRESLGKTPAEPMTIAITILGAIQLAFALVSFLGFLLEYHPNLLVKPSLKTETEMEFEDYASLWHNESIYMGLVSSSTEERVSESSSFLHSLLIILRNPTTEYNIIFLLVSLAAIFLPPLYAILLFDVFKRSPDLVLIVNSVISTRRQLLFIVILAVIVTYFFAMAAQLFFTSFFPNGKAYCDNLWECSVSSVMIGSRTDGGGLGTAMLTVLLSDSLYYPRVLFDMVYYAVVILIIRNIILGVIVDAFGEMRGQRNQLNEQMNQLCFVCGKERQLMESRGRGWTHHFTQEHSVFSYLAFMTYVGEKEEKDCTGLEKYVKDQLKKKDCSFFPHTSKHLFDLDKENPVGEEAGESKE